MPYPLTPSTSTIDSEDELAFTFEALSTQPDVHPVRHHERKLGDNELSYYLPGRATGVNDMYLHLGMKAPLRLMQHSRVSLVWTILRLRHPLLSSRIVMHDYDDVRFVYNPPTSPEDALRQSAEQLEWKMFSKDELIDTYLNGPRTLSDERLSYLVISRTPTPDSYPSPPLTPSASQVDAPDLISLPAEQIYDFEWFMCAVHCIGDGMALHTFANDFFCLLGSAMSELELHGLMVAEWEKRWKEPLPDNLSALPPYSGDSLTPPSGPFQRAAERVDFENLMDRQIGGHSFPRRKNSIRHTVLPTLSFEEAVTKTMIKKCKSEGVSIAGALFAICNIAWARMCSKDQQALPVLMYAAMNIRPCLVPRPMNDSYWFLAVGYFNVMLPNFIPSSCEESKVFWHRARSAKKQIIQAAKTPMLASRCREMATKRGKQSRAWAREDDEKAKGTWVPPAPESVAAKSISTPRAPSSALLGLSMLGNLDAVYKHNNFPDIKMHTLTSGSRQRHGGMLLFGYTFAGKMWVSLGYDENGFEPKPLAAFWDGMIGAMNEFLV